MLMELCGSCLLDIFSLFLRSPGSPDATVNSMDHTAIEKSCLPCIAFSYATLFSWTSIQYGSFALVQSSKVSAGCS